MSGVIIYRNKIINKTTEMTKQLNSLAEQVASGREAMLLLEEQEAAFQGRAWGSVKDYIQKIQLPLLEITRTWVEVQIKENLLYNQAASALPKVNCLDQDELERQLTSWQNKLDNEESRDNPRAGRIRKYTTMINEINKKLEAMDAFLNKTTGLYDKTKAIQEVLDKADTEINKVSYEPTVNVIYFGSVGRNWQLEFEQLMETEGIKALRAAGLTDVQIQEAIDSGISLTEFPAVWDEMQEQGIDCSEIKNMEELGYSICRTVEVWNSLDGAEDKYFFACLILGGEEKCLEAFHIDPNDLSDNMTIAMAEYACRLLEHGKEEALITLNNALLHSQVTFFYVLENGSRAETSKRYPDIYLERMYAGTAVLLQADTVRLAEMEAEIRENTNTKIPDGYEKLTQKHTLEMNMCAYWATQNILIHREWPHSYNIDFEITAINNYGTHAGIDYYMEYSTSSIASRESMHVDNTIVYELQMSDKWEFEELKKLEEAREKLVSNYVMKAMESAATMSASYASPEVAILVTTLIMAKNRTAGTVGGLDRLTSSESERLGIKGANIVAANLLNYASQLYALEGNINTKEYQILMEWFGTGSTYAVDGETKISFAGFYNPKALDALNQLQTDGLAGMAGWDGTQVDKIIDSFNDDTNLKDNNELKDICEKMIRGGYQLVNEEYNAMNISEFQEAIENLDRIIPGVLGDDLKGGIHKNLFQF